MAVFVVGVDCLEVSEDPPWRWPPSAAPLLRGLAPIWRLLPGGPAPDEIRLPRRDLLERWPDAFAAPTELIGKVSGKQEKSSPKSQ